MDGDSGSFSDQERIVIQAIFQSVSEDFRPWRIDVTTEDPGGESWYGMRAVVDGSNKWGGGWAYVSTWGTQPPAFNDYIAYTEQYDQGDETWLWVADTIVHEVGHTLGLHHDGQYGSQYPDGKQEYYTGHGSGETEWCPSMGWGAYSLNVWSKGDYYRATNTDQHDLELITAYGPNGIPYRNDDHGNVFSDATDITSNMTPSLALWAEGIIGRNDVTVHDIDFFSFTLTEESAVRISINKDVILGASNLDAYLTVFDAASLASQIYNSSVHDPNNEKIGAEFSDVLGAGTYYFSVEGKGWGNPMANPPYGYSDYGLLGYYSIHGSAASTSSTSTTTGATTTTSSTTSTTASTTTTTSSCPYTTGLSKGESCVQACQCTSNKCTGKSGFTTCK